MNSLGPETIAYAIVAVFAIAIFARGAYEAARIPDRPRIAYVLVALSAGMAMTAIAVFFSSFLRWSHGGMIAPKHGLYIRSGVEGGVVLGLLTAVWWRFWG